MLQNAILALLITLAASSDAPAQITTDERPIPAGAAVYIERMGGFENDLTVALINARLPIVLVSSFRFSPAP